MTLLVVILGIAFLMVVHESGHHFVARAFGMRVVRFSIGFGPTLWKHQPKGSDTVYQVALIPFIAYVQIAGMNPFEDIDPDDKGSYANASLVARISTIFAGPLANYLFASVFFFAAFMIGGKPEPTLNVEVIDGQAAAAAGMKNGDKIVAIDGQKVDDWEHMRRLIQARPGQLTRIKIEREGSIRTLEVTPAKEDGDGRIGVMSHELKTPMPFSEAAVQAVITPAIVVERTVVTLAKLITFQESPQLMGPVGIAKEGTRALSEGWDSYLGLLGVLSAYLGAFNLVPFPALDGARLMFLGYEAVTRRRPDQRMEAQVHMVGLLMLLALIVVVTWNDISRVTRGEDSASSTEDSAPGKAPSPSVSSSAR
jgi:regulator of sigma E protease